MSFTGTTMLSYPTRCSMDVVISIEKLRLVGNMMACIHPEYFSKCPWINLKELNLKNNNFGSTRCVNANPNPMKFLENLTKLESLDLSRNRLTSFAADLSRMQNLRHLSLSHNELPAYRKILYSNWKG